jgi:hypothetical protein
MAARKKTPRRRGRAPAAKAKPRRKRVQRPAGSRAARARKPKAKRPSPVEPKRVTGAAARRPRAVKRARPGAAPAAGGGPSADAAGERRFAAALALLASQPVPAGVVRHHFARAGVARVALELPLARGDRIHVLGATSDFLAQVGSLRVDGEEVARAGPGDATLALPERARPGDVVYLLRAAT